MLQTERFYPQSAQTLDSLFLQTLSEKLKPDDGVIKSTIRDDDDLWEAVRVTTGIAIPRVKVCRDHVAPFTAFADAYFARHRNSVWEASRGFGGKSVLLATLAFMEATELGAAVNLLGGSGEQAGRVHGYMTGEDTNLPNTFWGCPGAPRHLLVTDTTKRETKLTNGGRIVVLQASTKSVRGPHPARLRLDEVDEMAWDIFDAATGQAMSVRGIPAQTVMSSTHQYANGTFTKVKELARDKGWAQFSWCFRETQEGWLPQAEVEAKKGDVTANTWLTEYELQEPAPESRAIAQSKVKAMFKKSLGHFKGALNEYIEIEPPMDGARYAHGADWARTTDYTVIVTFRLDVMPHRLVAFERTHKQDWPAMVALLEKRKERFGGSAAHDGTGLGDVIQGFLLTEAEPVVLTGKRRYEVFNNYIVNIERGMYEAPYIEFMQGEHHWASVEDLFGRGHPPDSFVAGAMADYAKGYVIDWTQSEGVQQVEDHKSKWRDDDRPAGFNWG